MNKEKCCCNCLHCARWSTSKGIECHCDLTNRYLGYLEVMDTDNDCCRWEKETKWDLEKEHDAEVYNKGRVDAINEIEEKLNNTGTEIIFDLPVEEILGEDIDLDDFAMLVQDAVQVYRKMVLGVLKQLKQQN